MSPNQVHTAPARSRAFGLQDHDVAGFAADLHAEQVDGAVRSAVLVGVAALLRLRQRRTPLRPFRDLEQPAQIVAVGLRLLRVVQNALCPV